jgi:hypothetical protein
MLRDAAPLRRAASNPANPSSRNYPTPGKQIGSQNAILPIAWWLRLNAGVVTEGHAGDNGGRASRRRGAKEWLMFQPLKLNVAGFAG